MRHDCDDALNKIYPYLDGEMTWWRARVIRHHLRDCPPCGSSYSFEERLRVVVRERCREEPPADLLQRLEARLREAHAMGDSLDA